MAAASVFDAVNRPRNSKRGRKGADADREEADDDDCSAKIMAVDHEENVGDGDRVRLCGDFVCTEPHLDWHLRFGGPLWDVIFIKIRRNMKYHESKVRIHGAIRVHTVNHFTDYLFKRSQTDYQEFENPGEVLTLSLVGPHKAWLLEGFSSQPGLCLYALLKYNDEDIFPIHPDETTDKRYTMLLKGCPERYRDDGYWGDFEDYSDLFSGKEDCVVPVGHGWFSLPYITDTNLYKHSFYSRNGMLDKVASVEVEMVGIGMGLVARLTVTSSRDLDLYGQITARSCQFENGVVLFHKTQEEAMAVKSNVPILLSRSMAAVDCRASLVIRFDVKDAKDSNFLVDETIQFNVLPKGHSSRKTTLNEVFSVKVEWTYDIYGGSHFIFPRLL